MAMRITSIAVFGLLIVAIGASPGFAAGRARLSDALMVSEGTDDPSREECREELQLLLQEHREAVRAARQEFREDFRTAEDQTERLEAIDEFYDSKAVADNEFREGLIEFQEHCSPFLPRRGR